jgi:hypothetical protein
MAPRIVQFRVPRNMEPPDAAPLQSHRNSECELCGIRCLLRLNDYDSATGIHLKGEGIEIL